MRYHHILFDADNTLFDFTESSHLAFNDTLHHFGVKSTEDFYQLYKPINSEAWGQLERKEIDMDGVRRLRWQKFWSALGLDHDPLKTNTVYLRQLVVHSFLLDDTLEILDYLSSIHDLELHIITNGMKEAQRPRISKLGLEKYFKTITVSDEIGFAKPDPAFFDIVLKHIKQAFKSDCLVVGDSLHSDIRGGNNYGIDTCWYNPNINKNETDIQPSYEIDSLLKIKDIIN